MDVYWLMFEQPGAPREELNMIERNSAYGISCRKTSETRYTVGLSSLKDRQMTIYFDTSGLACAEVEINGQPAMRLERVFVQMTSSWGIPTVAYVELFGFDPHSMEDVYEKKVNK